MGNNKRAIGSKTEKQASLYLEELGYQIIDRNWHFSNRGELDIIAIDPKRFNMEYLVFVEVRSRDESLEMSLQSLGKSKQKRLKWLASRYLGENRINPDKVNISFDFIAISGTNLEHIKDIFIL